MLKTATGSWLRGGNVAAAVLSSPDQLKLTAEEIPDVFDYLGVRNLMAEPDTLEDLYAISAAYAALGMVLCGHYTDPYACEREEYRFPTQRLLLLDFTPESLSGTMMSLKSAKDGSAEETFIDLDLGLGRLDALNTSYIHAEARGWCCLLDSHCQPHSRARQILQTTDHAARTHRLPSRRPTIQSCGQECVARRGSRERA